MRLKTLIYLLVTFSVAKSFGQCAPASNYDTPVYIFPANSVTNFTTQTAWPDVQYLCGPNTVVYDTTHTFYNSCNNVYINAGCTYYTSNDNGSCPFVSYYYVKSGGTINILPNPNNPGSYIWYESGAIINDFSTGMTSYTCASIPPPLYTCTVTSITKIAQRRKIEISPNPVKDNLFIKLAGFSYEVKIQISNSLGQIVKEKNYSGREISLNLSDLPNGIYSVILISPGIFETKKILLTKE